jgi:hypothetical protein
MTVELLPFSDPSGFQDRDTLKMLLSVGSDQWVNFAYQDEAGNQYVGMNAVFAYVEEGINRLINNLNTITIPEINTEIANEQAQIDTINSWKDNVFDNLNTVISILGELKILGGLTYPTTGSQRLTALETELPALEEKTTAVLSDYFNQSPIPKIPLEVSGYGQRITNLEQDVYFIQEFINNFDGAKYIGKFESVADLPNHNNTIPEFAYAFSPTNEVLYQIVKNLWSEMGQILGLYTTNDDLPTENVVNQSLTLVGSDYLEASVYWANAVWNVANAISFGVDEPTQEASSGDVYLQGEAGQNSYIVWQYNDSDRKSVV